MKSGIKGIIALVFLAVFGFSTMAYAGWGPGYGHMMGPRGLEPGRHYMGGHGFGQGGYYGAFSVEEQVKLNQLNAEFFKTTEKTRQQLYEKKLALQSELAKENPDTSKASKLQNEISQFQGELDQKRLNYNIKARKSVPNYYSRGYRGYGSMMRPGPCGGRYGMW